jgi:hypothetical protein
MSSAVLLDVSVMVMSSAKRAKLTWWEGTGMSLTYRLNRKRGSESTLWHTSPHATARESVCLKATTESRSSPLSNFHNFDIEIENCRITYARLRMACSTFKY